VLSLPPLFLPFFVFGLIRIGISDNQHPCCLAGVLASATLTVIFILSRLDFFLPINVFFWVIRGWYHFVRFYWDVRFSVPVEALPLVTSSINLSPPCSVGIFFFSPKLLERMSSGVALLDKVPSCCPSTPRRYWSPAGRAWFHPQEVKIWKCSLVGFTSPISMIFSLFVFEIRKCCLNFPPTFRFFLTGRPF